MNLNGIRVRDFSVPARYDPSGSATGLASGDKGIYNNLARETVALSTSGQTLCTATENALAQDGPPASSPPSRPRPVHPVSRARNQSRAGT